MNHGKVFKFMSVMHCTMKVLKANRNVRVSDSRAYAQTNPFKRNILLLFKVQKII